MKNLRVTTGPFDLLGPGGYSAGTVGAGRIDRIDSLLEVSMSSN